MGAKAAKLAEPERASHRAAPRDVRIDEGGICDLCGWLRTVVECNYPASEFELEID
jgi:hypothetical protein